MNFLGMGPGELLLIMVLALIVFGPGKLPEIGQGLGRAVREFRKATDSITQEFNRELSLDSLIKPQQPQTQNAPSSAPVAEEPHPMAAPVVEEVHPAPEPVMEEAPRPETEPPLNDSSARPAVVARKRVRKVKKVAAAPDGEAMPAEAATPVQRIRKLRATKAATEAPEMVAASDQPEKAEV